MQIESIGMRDEDARKSVIVIVEDIEHDRIEVLWPGLLVALKDDISSRYMVMCTPIISAGPKGVVYVHQCHNARFYGDLVSAKASRITGAVPALMVTKGDPRGSLHDRVI